MIDWKILAAAFVALLLISGVLISNFGAQQGEEGAFFGNPGAQLSDWLTNTPFELPFGSSGPGPTIATVTVTLHTPTTTIEPTKTVNISGPVSLNGFLGSISFTSGDTIELAQKGQPLAVTIPWGDFFIEHAEIGTFMFDGSFAILPNISITDGSFDMRNFEGSITVTGDDVVFVGDVSKLTTRTGNLSWELV
ncbi:MAG: hypothetical protein KKA90_04635 [Nanoarchaeota archaeon]|nr:hypothetical protein [Nanoarchaeota archaeon]